MQNSESVILSTVGFTVPEGQPMVFNAKDVDCTLLIKGEEIHNAKSGAACDPLAFLVDSLFLQIGTLPISNFYKDDLLVSRI
ncbi:MAG: hypothetical protein J4G05_04765 [Chlorobi bacterium]|nr:hypothetical protein [Chlorobiota bacterium]